MKGYIKIVGKTFPPSTEPVKIEYERSWRVEEFESNFRVPKLSRFDPKAGPIANFRKIILRKD